MIIESLIARRYLSTRRKPMFVSFLLFLTVSGIATGVFALVFVTSVMNGFEQDFRQKVLGFKAPVVVWGPPGEDLSEEAMSWKSIDPKNEKIQRIVPFVEGEAILETADGATVGVRVRGVKEALREERLGKIDRKKELTEDGVLLGEELSDSLEISPYFPSEIKLLFPFGEVGPTGELLPRIRSATVAGTFHSGFYDFDSKYVVVPYPFALKLFGREARTGAEVWIDHYDDAQEVQQHLRDKIGMQSYQIKTWRDENPKLFAALKLEKIGMFLLLTMILLIASFTLFGLTSLLVLDKVKDAAILRTVGLSAARVGKIFLLESAGLAALGGLLGGGSGLLAALLLKKYPIRLPTSYYLEFLPIRIESLDLWLIFLLIPTVTLLASFYPARRASKSSPVKVLHYE